VRRLYKSFGVKGLILCTQTTGFQIVCFVVQYIDLTYAFFT
jgi:hypothetical protein